MHLDENGIGAVFSLIPWTYLASSAAAATVLALFFKKFLSSPTHKNGVPLPAGPPAKWFWEDPIPKKHIAYEFTSLVERYGPVLSLRLGSRVIIIIGRMGAATEIMEKEGGSLVDRPRNVAAAEILSKGMRLSLESGGERFRRLRRTAHTHLQPKVAQTYEDIQAAAAKELIVDILNDQTRHTQHAKRFSATVILRLTYGKTSPTASDDPEVVRIHRVAAKVEAALRHGAYLVNLIPWLKYVPGYGRQLQEFRRYELALFRDQLSRVKDDMAMANATPSFAKVLLENGDAHRMSDDEMAYLAGTMFSAGSQTTVSALSVIIMAAACHPDAQARVQEELDEVIGRDRAPTFEDRDMLPQLNAFLLESMRWRPVTPLGFAHRASRDIIWKGQCIPAGATVWGCHWSISRDPDAFPDPETFTPGRWLTEDGRVRTDMCFYTYGFGRRVCPGQHVANRSLYISLAFLIWSFRISQRPDKPINLGPGSFRDTLVFEPEPFEVDFVPRIEESRLRGLMT